MNNKLPTFTKTLSKHLKYAFAAKELKFGNEARTKML